MDNFNKHTVERHIDAIRAGNLADLPIADDIVFENPVSGLQSGADSFRAFLSGFMSAIADTRVRRLVCEGEYVVAYWEVDSVFGIIPILEIFRVDQGRIVESKAFFDPRPILGG